MIDRIPGPAKAYCFAFLAAAIATVVTLAALRPAAAQNQSQIAVAAAKTCAIMGGTQTADRNGLQLLLLVDEDMADADPVATALYRQVLVQCPKTYLAYERRKRANNPFKPGSLTSGTPQQLTSGSTALSGSQAAPPDYALRCSGADGMASSDARTLVVTFARGARAARAGLAPGHCSWLNRAVRPSEPARIVALLANADLARKIAANIDAGHTWTFWVFASGPSFHATAVAIGTPTHKP